MQTNFKFRTIVLTSFLFSLTHPVHHLVYLFVSSCNVCNLSTSNDDTPRFWLYVHRLIMFIGVDFSALAITETSPYKITPDLHLTYSKNGGNLGLVLKIKI